MQILNIFASFIFFLQTVPSHQVEDSFWSSASNGFDDYTIYFAFNLSTKSYDSGFPSLKAKSKSLLFDQEYLHHSWNLNNLTKSDQNLLKYMNLEDADSIASRM